MLKEALFEYFECTEDEYNQWLSTREELKKPIAGMNAELNELINQNRRVIEESGWLPFGKKARDRKKAELEIGFLEKEMNLLKTSMDLDGKEVWIHNLAFNSWEQYDRLKKVDTKLKLVFNNHSQVYEIRTITGNYLMGYTDRNFVVTYSRYRNLGAEVCTVENLTAGMGEPSKFRMKIRLFDND